MHGCFQIPSKIPYQDTWKLGSWIDLIFRPSENHKNHTDVWKIKQAAPTSEHLQESVKLKVKDTQRSRDHDHNFKFTRLVDSINNRRSHAVALDAHVMEIFEFCRWLKFEARWSVHFVTTPCYRHSQRVLTYNFHLWDRTNFHTKPWWSSDQRVIFYWDVRWFTTTRGFTTIFGILFKLKNIHKRQFRPQGSSRITDKSRCWYNKKYQERSCTAVGWHAEWEWGVTENSWLPNPLSRWAVNQNITSHKSAVKEEQQQCVT